MSIPVQAKGGADRLSIVQIVQDCAMGAVKFPDLTCLPVAAQFMENQVIALFAFDTTSTPASDLVGETLPSCTS